MFLKGLILGFSIAAPVGPIGLLCIQRTLSRGRLHGFASGLGAATADACYGLAAAFGLGAVTSLLLGLQTWLQLAGGLFLLWLAVRTFRTRPASRASDDDTNREGLPGAFLSVLLLTLANPATILSFFAVFAGLGMQTGAGENPDAVVLVAGVFLGSATWWLLLSFLAGLLRHYLGGGRLRILNVVAAICLLLLSAWSLFPVMAAIANHKS